MHKKIVSAAALILILTGSFCAVSWADAPASGGKFVEGKGTKAAPDYKAPSAVYSSQTGRGIQLGPVHLKPIIQYAAQWESNIFYQPSGTKSDLIHRLDAGFLAELPFNGAQHMFTAGYLAQAEWFQRFGEQDHTDHTAQGTLELNFVPFKLSVKDVFRDTVSRADTEFTDRTARQENAFNTLLEIPYAQFFLESELDDKLIDYDSDANSVFDNNVLTLFQRVGFDVAPSTQLLAEYGHVFIDYDHAIDNRDGDADQVSIGLRGNWGSRISYQVWPGVQWRIYDDAVRPDYHDFIIRGALQYDITDVSNIIIRGARNPVESTFDNQSFYTQNRLEIAWRQQVAERVFFKTAESVSFNEYSRTSLRSGVDRVRKDCVWQAGAGLEYLMPNEFLTLFCDYNFIGRNSNTANLDYDNHVVSAGIRGSF